MTALDRQKSSLKISASLRLCVSAVALLLLASQTLAQDEPEEKPDPALLASKAAHQENLARHKGDENFLVLPGLLANKKQKQVRLWGRATALTPTDAVEFFVIPTDSGKDYEALTVTFAKPSDVHRALEFIGLKPGRPVNYNLNHYWPKGERIFMTIEWTPPSTNDAKAPLKKVRAEELILDIRTKKPLPLSGLIFAGSYIIKPQEEGNAGKEMYAADVSDSRSIASDYNERSTVLDVPYQWPQSEVYGSLKPNPDHKFSPGQPLQIILEPEHRDGKTRVRELTLKVIAKDRFTLLDSRNQPLSRNTENAALVHILAEFGKLTEAGHDPYITLDVAPDLSLQSIRELFTLIQTLDRDGGIRVEAPPPGQLYYRAFFPHEDWHDRNKRLGRPWELHITQRDNAITGQLILPADEIDNNEGKGDLKFPANTPEDLAKTLLEKSDRWSQTIYIFAPPDLKYGDLLTFLRPSLKTHPGVYVFLPR